MNQLQQSLKTISGARLNDGNVQRLADVFVNLSHKDTMTVWQALHAGEHATHNISSLHSAQGFYLPTGQKVTVASHMVKVLTSGFVDEANRRIDNALTALEKSLQGKREPDCDWERLVRLGQNCRYHGTRFNHDIVS